MKKLIFIIAIIFLVGCSSNKIYDLRTDISDTEGVEKLIHNLDWDNNEITKIVARNNVVKIYFGEDTNINKLKNFKKFFDNGIILIALTGAEKVLYQDARNNFSEINRESYELFSEGLKLKDSEVYQKDKGEFNKLLRNLKKMKFDKEDGFNFNFNFRLNF